MNKKEIEKELKNAIESSYMLCKKYFQKETEKITNLNFATSKSSLQHITQSEYMINPHNYFHFQSGRFGTEIIRKEIRKEIFYINKIYGLPQKDLREEFYTGKISFKNWGENTTIEVLQEDYEEAIENFNCAVENIQCYKENLKRNMLTNW